MDSVYFGLWGKSKFKDKIVLGNHDLAQWSRIPKETIYGFPNQPNHDGIHMTGPSGSRVYTSSLISIFKDAKLISSSSLLKGTVPEYDPLMIFRQRISSTRENHSIGHPTYPDARHSLSKDAPGSTTNSHIIKSSTTASPSSSIGRPSSSSVHDTLQLLQNPDLQSLSPAQVTK